MNSIAFTISKCPEIIQSLPAPMKTSAEVRKSVYKGLSHNPNQRRLKHFVTNPATKWAMPEGPMRWDSWGGVVPFSTS